MGTNLGTLDRVIRVVLGVALVAAGLLFIRGPLGIAGALVGAVLAFSGSVGFCHVYRVLHLSSLRKR